MLTTSTSCGGAAIPSDTLIFISGNSFVPDSICTPAITDANGNFSFNLEYTDNLSDSILYSIISKNGMLLQDTSHKTIQEWLNESPISLYSTTQCNSKTTNSNISTSIVNTVMENSFVKIIPNPNNGYMRVAYSFR